MNKEGVYGDKITQLVGWWNKLVQLLWFFLSNVLLNYIQEMFTKQVRDLIDKMSKRTSRVSVSPPLSQQSSSPPPLASGSGSRLVKFQTVKYGDQENLNKGKIKIGNIGPSGTVSFNPSAMPAASMEFQTTEKGFQRNQNSGDIELWNWG